MVIALVVIFVVVLSFSHCGGTRWLWSIMAIFMWPSSVVVVVAWLRRVDLASWSSGRGRHGPSFCLRVMGVHHCGCTSWSRLAVSCPPWRWPSHRGGTSSSVVVVFASCSSVVVAWSSLVVVVKEARSIIVVCHGKEWGGEGRIITWAQHLQREEYIVSAWVLLKQRGSWSPSSIVVRFHQ